MERLSCLSVGSFLGSVTPKSWFIGLTGGEGDLAQNIYEITCAIILPTDDMTMMGMGNGDGVRSGRRDGIEMIIMLQRTFISKNGLIIINSSKVITAE